MTDSVGQFADLAGAPGAPAYAAVDDPGQLEIAVRELSRALELVRQFADVAAEFPGVPLETACGIRMAGSHVLARLIRQAELRSLGLPMRQQAHERTEAGDRSGTNTGMTMRYRGYLAALPAALTRHRPEGVRL